MLYFYNCLRIKKILLATLNPDSWKFIIASEMLTSNGRITFSALKGPARRSDRINMESEIQRKKG